MKILICSLFVLVLICQVQSAFKFICNKCAKDNNFVGYNEEDKFLEHCELHEQQKIEAQRQLQEDERILAEQEANAPKLFHCHFCPFVSSFNTSAEFVSHIEQEHQHTTIEENTDFLPQGKYKLKGGLARTVGLGGGGMAQPDLGQLFGGGGGGYGGGFGGGYGGGGGGYGGNIPLDGFGEGGGVQMDGGGGGDGVGNLEMR